MSPSNKLLQVLLLLISISWAASADNHENFLQCLSLHSKDSNTISKVIYTQSNSSYPSVLNFTIQNARFLAPFTPKPLVIVTALDASHVQATIICSRENDLHIRIRSGGHDFEGLSYVSPLPFVILDLINLSSIDIDLQSSTAWVQSGATLGELYYKIANTSTTLAFPAGICPSVGVGGHFSGGGYGVLMRKYGLAADNIIDAQFIDFNGRILNRGSMGEELFWAIRGGGGNSFGVVIAWRINLVPVPSTVAFFSVQRTSEQNVTKLVHRWQQIADKFDEDLFLLVGLNSANTSEDGKKTIQATFTCMLLGDVDRLVSLMQESFPELGIRREDCRESTWAESNLLFNGFPNGSSIETLLNRTPLLTTPFKAKSDYVKEPIPDYAWRGVWDRLKEKEAHDAVIIMVPYGARMSEISESATPFPHRAGNIYKMLHMVVWNEEGDVEATERHINWIRRLYSYLAPYVSNNPREAYINYRDLDLGINDIEGNTSYKQASIWGSKYFKNNFDRLVHVKTMIDPTNFFRNEQSIPLLSSWKN